MNQDNTQDSGDRGERIARVAETLEALRAGRVSCESVLSGLDALFADLDLDDVFDNLHHYLSDEDIRARDPGYRAMQEAELDKLISRLRSGAAPEQLARITFLGSSDAMSTQPAAQATHAARGLRDLTRRSMGKGRITIVVLAVALLASNAWWAIQLFDVGITQTYTGVTLDYYDEALNQTLVLLPVVARPGVTRDEILAAAGDTVDAFEKDGFVWIGRVGLKFDARGRLVEAMKAWE